MFYINKNITLNSLQKIVEKTMARNLDYFPNEFSLEQKKALEVFQKRILLEKIIDKSISFNRKLSWDNSHTNLHLATTAEELIEIYKLRSDVYGGLNYNSEFPDMIEGLNFDNYDKHSGVLYTKTNGILTSTCRLIFDYNKKLPTEEKVSFANLRLQYKRFAEISRLIISHRRNGLNLEFKNLTKGIYLLLLNNSVDLSVSVIQKNHFKLYSKFGGFRIEQELNGYGELESEFVITSWNHNEISDFFKKAFLGH